MDELALHFFPFPHVFKGKRRDGLRISWAPPCRTCDRQCERSKAEGIQLCTYGVNFYRFDADLLVAGVVVRDYAVMTSARKKALKSVGKAIVYAAELETARMRAMESTAYLEAQVRAEKNQLITEYRDSQGYQADVLEQVRPEIQKALGQVHDYKQFVQQVVQNMNVILQNRFPGLTQEEQLDRASHEETAIYWAARLMEEKLDAALFLLYPDRITDDRELRRFRFHGMVTKYIKIYQRRLESLHLTLIANGHSYGFLEANPRAVPIIPHTFIDNAIKYAPERTRIELTFREDAAHIDFSVGSYGPLIYPDEVERIFDVSYRGRAAAQRDREGTGYGLAAAQTIAKALGAEIRVVQKTELGPEDCRWTEFTIRLDRAR